MGSASWISTRSLVGLSLLLHLGLCLYADHVDSHPEKFGGLRYTDVDWRVVTDGAALIFNPKREEDLAKGWLARRTPLKIGDPYERATFRYTPLLPLLLSPALVHPLLGKLALSLISLAVPFVLLAGTKRAETKTAEAQEGRSTLFWPVHLLWTLNPFVLNITTRGSPEAIIVLLVVALIACLRGCSSRSGKSVATRPPGKAKEAGAAILLALAVSYKIYPAIYIPSLWSRLAKRHGWFGSAVWRFGAIAAGTLGLVNGALWSIWGQPFLDQTFLYHLTRLDHRHNFSPYYYPIYLSLFDNATTTPSALLAALRHPLTSFVPQASLVLSAGFLLTRRTGLDFAMFVQTTAFVISNKVCTSQYFLWWISLLSLVIPNLKLSGRRSLLLLGIWILGQAVWLGTAFQLELMARSVHLWLWTAGIGLFAGSVWVLGELVDAWTPVKL